MRAQITTRDYEQLSAYLDGQLSPTEQTRLEERLRANPELRTALEEMNRTRTLIRMAPRRRAPRNFTLTPSMVQPRQTRPRGILNLFPALSFASAIATLALVLSFLFELSPGVTTLTMTEAARESTASLLQREGELPAESAPDAGDTSFAAPEAAAGEEVGKAPPAITWGFPGANDMGLRGMGGGPGVVDGRGGGGMGGFLETTVLGVGGGASDGSIVVPPEGVASLEDKESAGILENNADQYADVPRIEGSGPILGAPPPEEAGQIIEQPQSSSSPTASEPIPSAPEADSATGTGTSDVFGMPALRFIQVLLGGLAVITGLAALLIWRRAR